MLHVSLAKSLFNTTRRRSRPSFFSAFLLRAPFSNDVPVLLEDRSGNSNLLLNGKKTKQMVNEHIHARVAKTIYRLPRNISDQDALESTRWEPLSNQYKKKLFILMYKVNGNITPDKIANLFSVANPHYNLRNSNHFVLPRYNLDIGRNSLRY